MAEPQSVLVVRLDALGDTILSLPALEALRRAWPRARITILASPVGAPACQGLGEVWEVPRGASAAALGRRLRALRPDWAFVFTEKRLGYNLAWRSGARQRVGFDPGATQPLKAAWLRLALTRRVNWPNDPEVDPGLHEIERYLRLVEAAGVQAPVPQRLRLPVQAPDRDFARAWLQERSLVAPLALQLMPRWSAEGWPRQLLEELCAALPRPLVAFFAPADRSWAEPLALSQGLTPCCLPELGRWAAVLGQCRALITPDTGAVHVAAAMGVPVVDLFPQRHARHCVRRWRPFGVAHRVVLRGDYRPGAEKELARTLARAALDLARAADEGTPSCSS